VVSTSIAVDGRSCEVVGVMTPAIEIGNMSLIDVWMPLVDDPARAARDVRVLSISGRLRPGMTVAEAGAEVQTIAQQLQREHPDTNAGWTSRTLSARDAMAGTNTHLILGMLMLVVVFILLIACANVANLMLARVTGRRRELAVRTALGATRWTIVRELVSESCWLGGAGGVLGLALAHASLRVIRAAAEEPFFKQIVIDRNVILFAFVLSFLTPLLFSVLPALHSSDVSAERLKDGGRTSTGQRTRSRAVLVIAQVSLALMLLVVAGLVLRTLVEMNRVDYGFNPGPILTAEIEMPAWKYANRDGAVRFERDLLAALRHSVDVEGAATTSALPVLETGVRTQFDAAGRASQAENRPWAFQVRASDRYFDTIGIPILRGRQFTDGDREGREPVAVIDAETARRYWSSVDQALGAKIALAQPGGDGPQWRRIVGIVGSVANPDVELASDPHVYLPMLERPSTTVVIVIRTSAFERASGALRKAVASIDRDVPLFNVRSMTDRIGEELSSVRILTMLFVAFAAIALALASGGLYSVISYSVGTRSQEIGVRMALGAVPTDIHRLIFKQGFQLVVVGTLIGLGGAALLGRALSSMLFNVTPFDPPTYVSVVVLVLASSVVAIVVPAWRATRLDPVRSLRAE